MTIQKERGMTRKHEATDTSTTLISRSIIGMI